MSLRGADGDAVLGAVNRLRRERDSGRCAVSPTIAHGRSRFVCCRRTGVSDFSLQMPLQTRDSVRRSSFLKWVQEDKPRSSFSEE